MKFPSGTTDHPINKSGKRKILVSVWDFGAVHPQSERSHYVRNDHPAKMRPSLARAILQLYGESPVLDPMTGIGTTLVEAMLLGMNAVGVEYERKFVDQANKNIEHVRKLSPNRKLGKSICVQGDARRLSLALKKKRVESILLSPLYEGALNASKNVGGIASRDPQLAKTGLYSKDRNNIGNMVGQTYLGEMLKVYRECYRVLKHSRFMIVVVKDIQRNWKTIPLGADTIKLCQSAGFDCHDVIINKMYFPSFWMLSLAKKSQTRGTKGT